MKDFARRRFLRGVGGVAVGLPMLDAFRAHEARAQGAVRKKVYSVFMMQANGVAQLMGREPEQFWPRATGPLSDATMMGADADRATSELAGFASKLIMVKLNFGFPGNGCGHSGGCNQALTAARVSDNPRGNKSLAMGESVDNRIARELTPGREPFALYAGPKPAYIGDALSYRGALQVRAADNNPWTAYQRLIGLGPTAAADPAAAQLLVARRKSVNDLLRAQVRDLQARRDLSALDRQRLDLHLSSIRDIEISMTRQLGPMEVAALQAVNGRHQENDRREAVTRLHIDLIAFALAGDMARTSTLQVGTGNDGTQYILDGTKAPPFHQISHRIYSDGAEGAPIPDAVNLHHKIDRIHGRHFKYMLGKLSAYTLPEGGTLLDSCVAVWLNSLANGPPHGYRGVPYIIAGSGGGFFKTGQYVNVGSVTNNKLFNSILTAVGVRTSSGGPIEDFGDPSLAKGMLTQIHA
jgi:hypothetical protein